VGATPEAVTQPEARARNKATVAVLYTRPATVLDDIGRVMALAQYQRYLDRSAPVVLKTNISWQHYYPGCSTSPWQLDGVIRRLLADGYGPLTPAVNGTVVVDPRVGERNNKHLTVLERHGLDPVFLGEPPVKWVRYEPKTPMLVLDKVYRRGIFVPDVLPGKNIVHLPTVKTHVFTTMTGAMKNAFGGLLNYQRHWTHSVIHETLVDLLTIQKEIHPGIFAVMDGTFAGDGPGPRAMRIHEKNVLLASGDQVAIDAVAARLMGFDPLRLKFIRLAHERGLGCGDPAQIDIVGDDVSGVNWHFRSGNTMASRGQWLIYHGPLKPLERLLLRSFLVPWSYAASNIYHNALWLPFIGRRRVAAAMRSDWGKLFQSY